MGSSPAPAALPDRPAPDRSAGLAAVAELLSAHAGRLSADQVAALDAALVPFARRSALPARAELAARIAPLPFAPPAILRVLARDAIAVAGAILSLSPCLDDQDLIAIAAETGDDHRMAIGSRHHVSAPVGDILVERGGTAVLHRVAANPGARLSPLAAAMLVERSPGDDTLQDLLGRRRDLDVAHLRRLVAIVGQEARRRLEVALAGAPDHWAPPAFDIATGIERARRDFTASLARVRALAAERPLAEADLAGFSGDREAECAICTVATLAALPVVKVEDEFDAPNAGLLLVVAKAKGWSWSTVRALLRLRNPALSRRHHFLQAETTFDGLSTPTSRRVLRLVGLQARRAVTPRGPRE